MGAIACTQVSSEGKTPLTRFAHFVQASRNLEKEGEGPEDSTRLKPHPGPV